MATSATHPDIPRRLCLMVQLPARLNSKAIDQLVAITASRLRFDLGQRYKAQTHARVTARIARGRACP